MPRRFSWDIINESQGQGQQMALPFSYFPPHLPRLQIISWFTKFYGGDSGGDAKI